MPKNLLQLLRERELHGRRGAHQVRRHPSIAFMRMLKCAMRDRSLESFCRAAFEKVLGKEATLTAAEFCRCVCCKESVYDDLISTRSLNTFSAGWYERGYVICLSCFDRVQLFSIIPNQDRVIFELRRYGFYTDNAFDLLRSVKQRLVFSLERSS